MRNVTKYQSMLMVVLSTLVFASQNRANNFRGDDCLTTTLTCHSPVSPDSCKFNTYIFYPDSTAQAGFSYWVTPFIRMGNYFPINEGTSGVIKSVDMCFSQYLSSTAQSCIVYFYKSDQTTIFGQSDPFINTAATWPEVTWVNVSCPDILYTGPFYAMVDYTITALPIKNDFMMNCNSTPPGFPKGLGFVDFDGVWSQSTDFIGMYCGSTFLQRANVCENDAVGINELSPGSISLYPNPANDFVNIISKNDIRTIEVLNYIGQTIYMANDVNLKVTKLDIAGFNAGEYFVKITTMSGIKTTKVTVIH
jgi:hypothetical protein